MRVETAERWPHDASGSENSESARSRLASEATESLDPAKRKREADREQPGEREMTVARALADLIRETESVADALDLASTEGIADLELTAPALRSLALNARTAALDARHALSSAMKAELPSPAYLRGD